MRILFLHDNFPAQFGGFAQFLSRQGWEVWFGTQRKGSTLEGVRVFNYEPHREVTPQIHPAVAGYERAVLNGQAVAKVALDLKRQGFTPDIVMAHVGWGPGLFVKDVWPQTKYVGYFEWCYRPDAPDLTYLNQDQPLPFDKYLRNRARNASVLVELEACDAGICPTQFQKEQFPECFHDKLTVMHDGIDTDFHRPNPGLRLELPGIGPVDELITYVARGMEPYRGFPEFIKILEIILRTRPRTHVAIVGEDRVAYGTKLPEGESYKKRALEQHKLDWSRVHFLGLLPRSQYLKVLQASSVHAYLTIPFVLSWSMLEAMSAGCTVVASDVAPVREIANLDPSAIRLVDHRNDEEFAKAIVELLEDRGKAGEMGTRASEVVQASYSAAEMFERKARWLLDLVGAGDAVALNSNSATQAIESAAVK